jgi:hypothetical protein
MTGKRFKLPTTKPADKTAPVADVVPFSVELREDLEIACLDAMRGDPWGPTVATRLQRTCIDVLRAHGLSSARVKATSDRSGTRVSIFLPGPKNRVNEVVLSLV